MPAAIGLVTVLYNSDDVLDGFFKSLSIQNYYSYHLYLIDNQNSSETEQMVARLSEKYKVLNYTYIKNDSNVGVAKANNQGIDLSVKNQADYTILLNNDIEFDQPYLLEYLYKKAVLQGEVFIVPKILYYDTKKIWMAGGHILEYKGITLHVGLDDDDGPVYNESAYFDYAPTCFMLIDNRIFKKIGKMDEDYFVYYDDTDFLYRAKYAGYKILYMPELTVLHKVSTSTGGAESEFSIFYNHRNRIYFILKYNNPLTRAVALFYTLSSRVLRYLTYNKIQRNALVNGLKAGFKLKASKKA
jgi:GT2 family glycosyltransferase